MLAKSPRSATLLCEKVPRLAPSFRFVSSCWPALHDLDGLLLAERQAHAVDAGVLSAEDELAVVGRARREPGRRTGTSRRRPCRRRPRMPTSAEARREVDADEADLLRALVDERLRLQEGDAGTRRVHRVRVRIAPVVLRDVRSNSRDPALRHRRGHVGLARGALVVHRRDDAGAVDLADARHGLVDVGAVVAVVDLDARAVGAAALIERRRGRRQRVGLVLQREHRRLEHGHQPDRQLGLRRVARAVVPQADRVVVDLLRRARVAAAARRGLAVAARAEDQRNRREHNQYPSESGHPVLPPSAGRSGHQKIYSIRRTSHSANGTLNFGE